MRRFKTGSYTSSNDVCKTDDGADSFPLLGHAASTRGRGGGVEYEGIALRSRSRHILSKIASMRALLLVFIALFCCFFLVVTFLRSSAMSNPPDPSLLLPPRTALRHINASSIDIRALWNEQDVETLEETASKLFDHWFVEEKHKIMDLPPQGIPGTGIDSRREALQLQQYLDCRTSKGKWVYDDTGRHLQPQGGVPPIHKQSAVFAACDKSFQRLQGVKIASSAAEEPNRDNHWHVRDNLKWYWEPSDQCKGHQIAEARPHHSATSFLPDRKLLCSLLRRKSILLVGDVPTQYLMHDLLLDWTSTKPLTCYGDLYCKEHVICGDDIDKLNSTTPWSQDTLVYSPLAAAPQSGHNLFPGTNQEQVHARTALDGSGGSAILRYRRSDSMFLNSSPSHPRHHPAFVHPHTGVRDINMYAVADARRSDVTILHKAPIPWPRKSAVRSAVNDQLYHLAASVSRVQADSLETTKTIQKLAMLSTTHIWLPELIESLRALKSPPAPQDALIVYRGGWQMMARCRQSSATQHKPPLEARQRPVNTSEPLDEKMDLGAELHNLQVRIQDHIMRKIVAPQLGIPFIDMATLSADRHTGYIDSPIETGRLPPQTKTFRKPADCLQMCLPSSGFALESAFLRSLQDILEWGWYSSGRHATWTGSDFVPVKERQRSSRG